MRFLFELTTGMKVLDSAARKPCRVHLPLVGLIVLADQPDQPVEVLYAFAGAKIDAKPRPVHAGGVQQASIGQRLLAGGRLGQVFQATFRLRPGDGQGPRAYLDRQAYFQTMERFLVRETGIHFIDTFRFLFGEVERVYASLRRLNPAIAGEDAGLIVLDHVGGVRALFDGNRLADHAARDRRLTMGEFLVEGSAASLRLDGDGGLWLRRFGANGETRHDYAWEERGFAGDCVHALQRHVVEALRKGGAIENTAEAYLRNLAIEAAVYRSSQAGARVAL